MWPSLLQLLTLTVALVFFISLEIGQAVDRSNFKKCEQSGFCKLVDILFSILFVILLKLFSSVKNRNSVKLVNSRSKKR